MLHGRRRETAAISTLLDAARSAHGSSLVIRGEPGVGKTALLAQAVDQARDMLVLSVVGVPAECELPFSGLQRLLRPALGHLDSVPAMQATALREALGLRSAQRPDRFLIALAVLSVLGEAATERAVLCVLDDAQWLDPETLDAVLFVGRRIDTEPIAVLFVETDGPASRCIPPEVPTLVVTGVDRVTSDAMFIERTAGTPAPEVRAAMWTATRGNPLALTTLADSLTAAELAGRDPLPASLRMGVALQQTLAGEVERLPPATQALLLLAAAEGSGDIGLVLAAAAASGLPSAAFEPAEKAGIVRVDSGGISFRHPLMRTAVYQAAPFGRRQAAHRVLADCLGDNDNDRRAWHRSAATVSPDDPVADELAMVARRAEDRGGHVAASAALERSADLTSDRGIAGRRLIDAADHAWIAGRGARAGALLDRSAALTADPVDRANIDRLRGLLEAEWGDRRVGYELLSRGAQPLAAIDPTRAARMLIEAGRIAWQDADLPGLAATGDRLAAIALPTGAPENYPARIVIGVGLVARGQVAAGAQRLSDAPADAELDDPAWLQMAASAAALTGDERTSYTLLVRALELARSRGAGNRLPHLLASIASLEAFSGAFTAAAGHAAQGIALAQESGQEYLQAQLTAVRAWMAAVQGRDADCDALAADAYRLADGHSVRPPIAVAAWALAIADLGAGRWPSALTRLQLLATPSAPEFHPMFAVMSAADFVEAAVRLDCPAVIGLTMSNFEGFVSRTASASLLALLARCRALLADGPAAEEYFEDALTLHEQATRRFDEARTRLLYGEFLRRSHRRTEARDHLRLAAAAFDQLGADPWQARARVELRAAGETTGKPEPSMASDLTPQQWEIVRLVAEGRTNRQIAAHLFLSPRTVDYHLRNVFTQLGITSRAELGRLPGLSREEVQVGL